MTQIVNLDCLICGERITTALEARFCEACACPVHLGCISESSSTTPQPGCAKCGGDPGHVLPKSVNRSHERKPSCISVSGCTDPSNAPTRPPLEATPPRHQRPTVITIICVLGFIGALYAVPMIFTDIARNIGAWYPPFLAFSAVVGFICMVGLWMMRKWAVFAYTGFFLVNQVVLLAMGHWSVFALLIPGIVIAIMFSQLSKMK